ncbi:MAG: DUF4347 domain-containing protein, partial [Lentisphaeria bacterium]|nr:DUF4347 domain-containing protein [Lentisphaeria bacterium]
AEMQSDNNQTASDELTPDTLAEMPVPPEMSGSDNADDTADADAADFAAADPESESIAFTDAPIASSETSERILVVLNSSVADADSIVNDLGDNVEVLRLEAGTDALDTINDYLDEHADTKYSAIHLVSHGSEGYITLNGEKIDSTTINPADWKAIGEHLTDDADILVYGCDTAKSEEGKALVQTIANLTGADVAASIDSTGANGNWDLEYRSGLIEAATIAPQSYQYSLEAKTITVTTLEDLVDAEDGVTSLREAITEANANGGEYTISFDQNLAKVDTNGDGTADVYQINLTSTLSISKSGLNLTIDGMIGTDRVILDGGDKYDGTTVTEHSGYQIMSVKSGTTVAIDGIQFQNAYIAGSGAAINNAGKLTVMNSVFANNTATTAGAATGGTAIYSTGSLTVTGSTFKQNTLNVTDDKGNGVVIYNAKGTAIIDASVFDKSTVTNQTTAMSVIYNTGTLFLTNSTVTGSSAGTRVAANNGSNSLVYVINSTIVGNEGSGIRLLGGYVINSIIAGNKQNYDYDGAAASALHTFVYSSIYGTLQHSSYIERTLSTQITASTSAGSVMKQIFGSDTPTLSADGTLTPVLAAAQGKALQLRVDNGNLQYHNGGTNEDDSLNWTTIQASTKVTQEVIDLLDHDQVGRSRATKTIGAVSAKENLQSLVVNTTNGLDEYDGKTSIEEAIAYANTLTGTQTVTFAQDLAYNHDADGDGENDTYLVNLNKSMTVNKSGLTLTIDGSIGEDKVTLDAGGKFRHFSFSNATITLQDMTLQNGAVAGNGGAISNSGTLTVDNVAFYDNAVTNNSKGGAIYTSGGLTVRNSEFIGNTTTGTDHNAQGGAIYAKAGMTVYDSLFQNNISRHNGGAITGDGTIRVYDSEFITNKSTNSSGGAIYVSATLIVDGSYFDGNRAAGRGDGIDVESGGNALISDSTFVNHGAKAAVYAIASGSGKTVNATIINSTFLKNTYDVVHYNHNKGTAHLKIYNSVLAGTNGLQVYTDLNDTSSVDVKNTIYTASTKFTPSASDGNIKATVSEIFGAEKPTLDENHTIAPILEAAKDGAAKLQVVTTQVDETTTRKDLQYSSDGGTTWTTVQTSTLANNDILATDQLGNARTGSSIGAVSLAATPEPEPTTTEVTLKWDLAESGYTYNGADQFVTVTLVDGEGNAVDGIEVTLKYNDAAAMHNAGSYTITVDANALNTALGTEYVLADGAVTTQTVEMQQKVITISNIAAANKEYNGLTDAAVAFGKDGILDVDADKVTLTVSGTFADQNVGTDKKVDLVWNLSGDASANYKLSGNVADTTADITAKEVALDWTADNSYIYNGKDQSGTVEATYTDVNGVEQDVVISFNESFKNAGDYTATAGSVANYTFTNATQDLTIGKATVTVTADNQTITEGNEDPTLTYMVEGLADGDVFTGTLVRAEGTEPGTYAITLAEGYTILNGEADMSGNYTLNYVGANLTIEAAAEPGLTQVTLEWTVGDYTYNGADQTVTVKVVAGNTVIDTINVALTYTFGETTVEAMRNAGEYTITVDAAALEAALGTEYVLAAGTELEKTVEMQQKVITVTAHAKSMMAGTLEPALTYTVEGLIGTDKLTGALEREAGTEAGEYDIKIGTLADESGNYKIDFTGAKFTITERVVDAAALVVTTTDDVVDAADGKVSLREAIEYAVNLGGGEITFAAGKDWESMGTITLDSTIAVSTDLAGDITIDGSYTKADGSDGRINIVNTAKKNIYLFQLTDTATATASSFTLKNLTFDGLNYTATEGAGVVSFNGIAGELNNVEIRNGLLKSTSFMPTTGGWIYATGKTLKIVDTTIADNTATVGRTVSSGIFITAKAKLDADNLVMESNNITGTLKGDYSLSAFFISAASEIRNSKFVLNEIKWSSTATSGANVVFVS